MNRFLKIQTFCLLILVNCNLFSDNLVNEHKTNPLEIIRSDNVLSDLHQRLEQIKKRQKVIGQKIDRFQGRLNLLGKRNLDRTDNIPKPTQPPYRPYESDSYNSPINVDPPSLSSRSLESPALSQKNETILQASPVTSNINPAPSHSSNLSTSEKIISDRNSIGFYIGACFPHDAKLKMPGKAEFSPGFQTELEYKRSFEPFYFGFSVGAKFYEINKVYDLPSAPLFSAAGAPVLTANQLSSITLSGQRDGKNKLIYAAVDFGGKYNFSDQFFITGQLSLGYAHSQHKIEFINDPIKSSDGHLYWAGMTGLGWQINETASLMLYYMLDGHGKSDIYASQQYSNTGLKLGIDF